MMKSSTMPVTARDLENQIWQFLKNPGGSKGGLKQAISLCQQLNTNYPDSASGWFTTSLLAASASNQAMALAAIEKSVALQPGNASWLLQKAICLLALQRKSELILVLEGLTQKPLQTASQNASMGSLLSQIEKHNKALPYYEQAIKLKPDESQHYYNLACLQRSLGLIDAAEENFNLTIKLSPADYEAYKIRSDLRTWTPENNHIESLQRLLEVGIKDKRSEVQIQFALAKELEDIKQWQQSFVHLSRGAAIRRSYMQYDANNDLQTMANIRSSYSANLFNGAIEGSDNSEPIFILGMPRTGTTLVERIISSHQDVYAAGELTNFAMQMTNQTRQLMGNQKLNREQLVSATTGLNFKKLGEAYIESTRPLTGQLPKFIDKLPLNYLYAGLIHLALPEAKIINLMRHPVDTCYSVFKQLFIDAYPFSYSLAEIAHYYVSYSKLMDHWHQAMPDVIHTVKYEQLVADPENESRKLIQYCGLDWQDDCLNFYNNKQASTTASAVQIRQPIYQSSVQKWRNYEQELAPLIEILEAEGIAC